MSPVWDSSSQESEIGRRGIDRPKTDLKHSNQSVIWPWAKSRLIISQSEQVGWWELARQVPRPSRDLNRLFPSLTPLVLSPCPPDLVSSRGCWVIQSPITEVTPRRRAKGAEDTTLLFNLSLTPFFSVFRTNIAATPALECVQMVQIPWTFLFFPDLFSSL